MLIIIITQDASIISLKRTPRTRNISVMCLTSSVLYTNHRDFYNGVHANLLNMYIPFSHFYHLCDLETLTMSSRAAWTGKSSVRLLSSEKVHVSLRNHLVRKIPRMLAKSTTANRNTNPYAWFMWIISSNTRLNNEITTDRQRSRKTEKKARQNSQRKSPRENERQEAER